MVNPAQTTISNRSKTQAQFTIRALGFTLIEILIVLAIISMVMALALPAIEQVTRQRVNSLCRQFIGVIRTIRNDSILLNQVHRLGVDFEKKVWWVEQQKEFKLLETEGGSLNTKKSAKRSEPAPSNFSLAEKFNKSPTAFPDGVSIDGVLKEKEGFRKEGVVFIHFFPNGYNEPVLIYINRSGREISETFTLSVQSTSGKVDFFKTYLRDFEAANSWTVLDSPS